MTVLRSDSFALQAVTDDPKSHSRRIAVVDQASSPIFLNTSILMEQRRIERHRCSGIALVAVSTLRKRSALETVTSRAHVHTVMGWFVP
jgi:hypothetical protein